TPLPPLLGKGTALSHALQFIHSVADRRNSQPESNLRFRISDLRCRNRPISRFPVFLLQPINPQHVLKRDRALKFSNVTSVDDRKDLETATPHPMQSDIESMIRMHVRKMLAMSRGG